MAKRPEIAFLFDLDNTLIDQDGIEEDLRKHLIEAHGGAAGGRYWKIFERLREELGQPDYMGALTAWREAADGHTDLMHTASFLLDYPYRKRVYRDTPAALSHAGRLGQAVIVTDGDLVFQPR